MKFKIIGILLIGGILMFSCSDNSGDASSATPVNISGKVQDGYRHLPISLKSDSTKLVVYRGDYVKFYVDDKGDQKWTPCLGQYFLNLRCEGSVVHYPTSFLIDSLKYTSSGVSLSSD